MAKGVKWNDDPAWIEYVQRYEGVIQAIAAKKTDDIGLRDDCAQDARIALLQIYPQDVSLYEDYIAGNVTEKQWKTKLDAYCRQVIKYTVLSTLGSMSKGNWYVGRIKYKKDEKGDTIKIPTPARYSSLDQLMEESGLQVDEDYNLSWTEASTDGLESGGVGLNNGVREDED